MAEQSSRREWETTITSVSLTKLFKDLIDKYNLSPTEVFRRGVAVTLHDLGINPYVTELNSLRSRNSQRVLLDLENLEKIYEDLREAEELTELMKTNLKQMGNINIELIKLKSKTEKCIEVFDRLTKFSEKIKFEEKKNERRN